VAILFKRRGRAAARQIESVPKYQSGVNHRIFRSTGFKAKMRFNIYPEYPALSFGLVREILKTY
jgi:hypothetical protein